MGYGITLKKYLDDLGINVNWLGVKTGIPRSTIYSSIKRDTSMRYDYALRISKVCGIPVEDICQYVPDMPDQCEKAKADTMQWEKVEPRLRKLTDMILPALTLLAVEEEKMQEDAAKLLNNYYRMSSKGREVLVQNSLSAAEFYRDIEKEFSLQEIARFVLETKNESDCAAQ